MVLRIDRTRYRTVGCNRVQRFIANLPVLSLNLDIALVSFP
jgi:hypothetical protein